MKKLASAALGLALSVVALHANAQTKFGEKGTLTLDAATGSPMLTSQVDAIHLGATPTLGFSTVTYGQPDVCIGTTCTSRRTRVTSFYINPRMFYFPIDNLSIGGEVLFASFSGTQITETKQSGRTDRREADLDSAPTAWGLMPMVGYNIALGDKFSIWPQGGIGFRRTTYTDLNNAGDPNDDETTAHAWWFFNADVPFLLHIAPHFALGAGPGFTVSLSESVAVKRGTVETSNSGYSTVMFRWFNAHLIGYF
jgi:opacity protein-like surface antigen